MSRVAIASASQPTGRWARVLAAATPVGAALVLVLAGCRATQPGLPPPKMASHSAGSARDAVLRGAVRASREGARTSYRGDGWALSVGASRGWRQVPDDPTSTLRLCRSAEGVELELAVKAFAIRDGMPLDTFIAAHRLWAAEDASAPVEYVGDEKLKETRGYSIGGDRETYYAFRVAGDRGYVIEASARGGVLSRQASEEFDRLVAGFRCHARRRASAAMKP